MKIWKEKWNYKPIFVNKVGKETRERFAMAQIAELYDVSSLTVSDFENSLIDKALDTSERLFKLNRIRPIIVCKEQVIVLNPVEFKNKIANKENDAGKCSSGYIYICRNKNKAIFLSDLLHELSHLYSFYSLEIREGGKQRFIKVSQTGYSIITSTELLYDGLNEATTDIFSKIIMKELFRRYPEILSVDEKDYALNYYGYPYHATLLEEIIFHLTEENVLLLPLLKSYIDGSSDFINQLKKELPQAVEVLKQMNNNSDSVFKAAFSLGGDDLVEKMKK